MHESALSLHWIYWLKWYWVTSYYCLLCKAIQLWCFYSSNITAKQVLWREAGLHWAPGLTSPASSVYIYIYIYIYIYSIVLFFWCLHCWFRWLQRTGSEVTVTGPYYQVVSDADNLQWHALSEPGDTTSTLAESHYGHMSEDWYSSGLPCFLRACWLHASKAGIAG